MTVARKHCKANPTLIFSLEDLTARFNSKTRTSLKTTPHVYSYERKFKTYRGKVFPVDPFLFDLSLYGKRLEISVRIEISTLFLILIEKLRY